MKRILIFSLFAALFTQTEALAQRDLLRQLGQELRSQGRQMIEREFGTVEPGRPSFQEEQNPPIRSMGALPSEGGSQSGGGPQDYQNGNDFRFVPNPVQNPQPADQYQFLPNSGQPLQNKGQGYDTFYRDGFSNNGMPTRSLNSTYASSDLPSSPVMSNQYAVIRCPENVLGTISYSLKSSRGNFGFSLSGGQEQRFRVNAPWSISYNDGTQQRRYAIRGGKTYTMKKTKDNLWQLYSVKSPGS